MSAVGQIAPTVHCKALFFIVIETAFSIGPLHLGGMIKTESSLIGIVLVRLQRVVASIICIRPCTYNADVVCTCGAHWYTPLSVAYI